jgi:dynein heavy chain
MKIPNDTEELVELIKYVDTVKDNDIQALRDEISAGKRRLDFLLNYSFLPDEDLKLNGVTLTWPTRILPIFELSKKRLNQKKTKAQEELKLKVSATNDELEECFEQVKKFQDYGIMSEMSEYNRKIKALEGKLEDLNGVIQRINVEETLLEWEKTPFARWQQTVDVLEPYKTLWETAGTFHAEFNRWMNGPFMDINADDLSEQVNAMWRTVFKLTKTFHDQPVPRKVADNVRIKLDKFKVHLPLITVLRNPGLKTRHWDLMAEIVGASIAPTQSTTVSQILELNLTQYLKQLETISESATKEYSLQKALSKMKDEWQNLTFNPIEYKDTGTHILSALDDIQILLDDQIVKVQTMHGSPFIKPIEQEVNEWEAILTRIQDIIDAWLTVQATWLYLEPIFSSEDIMAQMPAEGKKFRIVDRTWREVMAECAADPQILTVCAMHGLLDKLKECNVMLEDIQKGLNDYLEKKRLYFPRFFFLSNDELLEILSETKDPTRVQPHLKKCFEGIASLTFQNNGRIIAMCSSENEKVRLKEFIEPAAAKGAVEKWLLQVEKVMLASVQEQIGKALRNYMETARDKFVLQWPGQVVLCMSQIFWTKEVEEVLVKGGGNHLKLYREHCTSQLEEVVKLVRGPLQPMSRLTLSALVVIDVHARDVVQELEKQGVTSVNDFAWLSQLRYYFEGEDVQVKMINATLKYGYEYLGNSPRLVITPLTDRCYRTLISALDLNLGGAPEGPAGTGKTETVKDLAKAVAKQCVVFNCSDGLDYIAMGKFFKGLASSGAWACFDEFNRIELEVLSVVAQQVLTIQRAVAAKQERLFFEGSSLSLNPTCSVFITMNPGYAGRSELPDNLKALFRAVAMMVPDYALIAEISLYSFGFVEARALSRKIVATFRLCSEQLSSQDHYDYGMRAVKAVLSAARNLKLKYPDEDEQIIMLRSIRDVNLPKFLAQDVPLFEAITSDLFPKVVLPKPDYKNLVDALQTVMIEMNLQPAAIALEKIIQVYEMMLIRHGYMLVGQPWAGKTVALRVLAKALRWMAERGIGGEQKVEYRVINPKSITMGQLYGQFDPVTHEWTDGVIANIFRTFITAPPNERSWVVFDGPVDAIWIENMNTVLDDNKKLCLTSGEIMQLTPMVSIIFEVQDLAVASPATVSRCGMIYMEPDYLGWRPLVLSWINQLPETLSQDCRTLLIALFDWIIPPSIDFLASNGKAYIETSTFNRCYLLQNMLSSHFDELKDRAFVDSVNPSILSVWLTSFFLFSAVWALGGCLDQESRQKFDVFFRALIEGRNPLNPPPKEVKLDRSIPSGGIVFDYVFEKEVKP